MARKIDNKAALALLEEIFPLAEDDFRDNADPGMSEDELAAIGALFLSETQAYREALVGCAVARVLDPQIDIRLPATEHGDNAFSGRSLADQVITPFMRGRAIPVSASPYLSALRGGARFVEGGEPRIQRDKQGFAALVFLADDLMKRDHNQARAFLRFLLRRFVHLREDADIPLRRIAKPNLEQLRHLIMGLLGVKSGGRFPSFLATAMFQTIGECHNLGWEVEFQGINVADKFTGAVGDITVRKNGAVVLGIEVTERPIGKARVTQTFDQKIGPNALTDYLFVSTVAPEGEALETARHYTAVGHEMNFVPLPPWLVHNLSVLGPPCRTLFQDKMIALMGDAPAGLKVAWNEEMEAAIAGKNSN